MVYTHVMSYYLFWKLTLLNLPRDMTLESSLAASFFSATFNTLQGLAILIAQLAVGAARVYSAQIMRMRIGRCHARKTKFICRGHYNSSEHPIMFHDRVHYTIVQTIPMHYIPASN